MSTSNRMPKTTTKRKHLPIMLTALLSLLLAIAPIASQAFSDESAENAEQAPTSSPAIHDEPIYERPPFNTTGQPYLVSGGGETWNKAEHRAPITVRTSGVFVAFDGVAVDGAVISAGNYEAHSYDYDGVTATCVTLNSEAFSAINEHSIAAISVFKFRVRRYQ